MKRLSLGYVPCDPAFEAAGDRRRFVHYARRRGLAFDTADPGKSYDAVVVTQRGDLSVWSRYDKGKVVYDLVDPYLDVPRWSLKGLLRGAALFAAGKSRGLRWDHREAVRDMCRRADAVVCGSPEQGRSIGPYCANVHVVLDFLGMYDRVKEEHRAGPVFKLAWEGQPHNAAFFRGIQGALRESARARPMELHWVTNPEYKRFAGRFGRARTEALARGLPLPVHVHAWEERSAPALLTACDLAVIPLPLGDPFFALKPENKLLLFWRMGIPALVSAAPAYERVMAAAGVDMACRTGADWRAKLEKFTGDESARREAAAKGLAYVRSLGDEERLLARWDAVFASLGLAP